MKDYFPIYKKSGILTIEEFNKIDFFTINRDWYGQQLPLSQHGNFKLAVDSENLFLCSMIKSARPFCNLNYPAGSFIEGLWDGDVGEFFIKDDQLPAYQEFNFSPAAAWWSVVFSRYRQRDLESSGQLENINVRITDNRSLWRQAGQWMVTLVYPIKELKVSCNFDENSSINAAFYTYDNGIPSYLSQAEYQGIEPDFHLVEGFNKLKVIAI